MKVPPKIILQGLKDAKVLNDVCIPTPHCIIAGNFNLTHTKLFKSILVPNSSH